MNRVSEANRLDLGTEEINFARDMEMRISIPLWQSVLQKDTIDKEIMWYLAFSHNVVAGYLGSFYIVTVLKGGEGV